VRDNDLVGTWWTQQEPAKEPSNAKNADFDHVLTAFSEKIQDAVR
jgi:hypothetical protein